ncbi:hypothetical protein [Streptomyces aureoverticillatus]|uniref:hypothetical protein n=1 Tax=Streptomyces aureoverticillatus TaxID=66871 RepID=UPI0013DD7148|nr:hypothetical protein [Streptomyces aureoverticillatus]QIB41796.1 hypothetical protein G3H79_00555 [Streptomyces aureoverticillatus]
MSRKGLATAGLLATALTATLAPSAQAATATLSRAEYDKVKIGASIAKLHSVAGNGACKKTASQSGPGYSSKVYTCKGNKRYSTAMFTFGNGKLSIKSQAGLDGKKSNGKMTKAKYKKITKGKTIAQMHSAAGKGVCVRSADSQGQGGIKTAIYLCEQSRTYGSASFGFTNGKLDVRSQYGLR